MAPPKSKPREQDEDVSQLRKPITLHGKPIEQILNSVHYGSPELRSLLLNECDIIFECKVCRALFRDLPNFIAHKRRYCSKSASDINHYSIGELPDEKVIVVHPEPADGVEVRRIASSSRPCLEDTLHRIRTGECGKSHAFAVQDNAAARLRHKKEHAKVTSIRTRDIPTNSNAVFIDVNTTSVNIHERASTSGDHTKSNPAVKTVTKKAGEKSKCVEKPHLRSKSSTNKTVEDTKDLSDMLMKELKVIQSKIRQGGPSHRVDKTQQSQQIKATVVDRLPQLRKKIPNEDSVDESSKDDDQSSIGSTNDSDLLEVTRQNWKKVLVKSVGTVKDSGPSTSKASSDSGDVVVSKKSLRKSRNSLICSKCGKIFSCVKSLRFHIKVSHSVKRTLYPCLLCSRVYYYLEAVTRHLKINHDKSKKEIAEMRQEVRSKAFIKNIPLNESVKPGTRKERFSNRKVNNAPYFYSLVQKGKRLSAKKDSILNDSVDASEKKMLPNECKSQPKSSNLRNKVGVVTMKEESKSHTFNDSKVPSPVKSSISVDTEMQTCPKCSRLFGRKATYENHIKICEGKTHTTSAVVGSESKPSFGTKDNSESTSVSTRSKGKETNPPSAAGELSSLETKYRTRQDSNATTTHSTNTSSHDTKSVHRKSSTPVRIDQGKKLMNAERSHLTHSSNKDQSSMLLKSQESTDKSSLNLMSPHKTLHNSSDSSFTKTRVKSRSGSETSNSSTVISNSDHENVFKVDMMLKSSLVPGGNVANKGSVNSGKQESHFYAEHKETNAVGITKNENVKLEPKPTVSEVSSVLERPRRKRKVPSRNIGAVELLQKIHRVDKDDEPLGKKVKQEKSENEQADGVLRTRATANKIFVLNSNNVGRSKSKLQCYDHSRVNKFIDEKKTACLKCGAKFSFMHNLKRHIIRLHLKWSRFQCKLCNFNCFDKSECNTHIIRRHRNGQKPGRNHFFNTLIVDLAKKGSKAMTLKKHQTLKAKSQQQKDDDKNIYKNTNAQKVPRLHERTLESDASVSSPVVKSIEKQKNQPAEVKNESPDKVVKDIAPVMTHLDRNRVIGNKSTPKVSHLVQRVPTRITSAQSDSGDSLEKTKPQITNAAISVDKTKMQATNLTASVTKKPQHIINTTGISVDKTKPLDESNPKVDKELTTKSSSSNPNSNLSSTSCIVKRISHPFNISTRNSPRVFDTSPYNREETVRTDETASHIVEKTTSSLESSGDIIKEPDTLSDKDLKKEKSLVNGEIEEESKTSKNVDLDSKEEKIVKLIVSDDGDSSNSVQSHLKCSNTLLTVSETEDSTTVSDVIMSNHCNENETMDVVKEESPAVESLTVQT